MDRYIGLDVHTTSCTFAVVGPSGKRLRSAVVETNGQALLEFLGQVRGARHLCFEECTQSEWLYEVLSPHVAELVVAGLGARKQARRKDKSDLRDAFGLAEQLRIGGLETRVYKGLGQFGRLRKLVRVHSKIVEDVVRAKNRLKAMYRSRGISTPANGFYPAKDRERWLACLPSKMRDAAQMLFEEHDVILVARRATERAMLAEARKHKEALLLRTCPGIGEIRAAQLAAIIVSPHRFRTKRQLW